jgi:uncharacterized protein YdhG (YjbR/CyaY superfamily)|tara:strand:+ start:1130 stop:1585 length:456 start_codon:yes stop_codon:yes gene_type:complete
MKYTATSPDDYLSQLPEERAIVISKLRSLIQENIPEGFTEEMSYGMIGYIVPHSLYSEGYHCDPSLPLPFINIASQKNFIAFYHMGMYADKNLYDWFVTEYPKHCSRKLDMGKSCIRFKKTDDIPYELLAKLVRKMTVLDWVSLYEEKFKK